MAKITQQLHWLLALVLLGAGAWIGAQERSYRALSAELSEAAESSRTQRWQRPVLRGAMRDGNAATEIYDAVHDFASLGPVLQKRLAEKVYFGQAFEPDLQSALSERQVALRALRDSAQLSWSRTDLVVERGEQMLVPDYPKLLEMAIALLAQAQMSEPAACLQVSADVLRVSQDIIPSAPLEAASVAARIAAFSARVVARCARSADLVALRRASHELHVLATHPAPIGSALELEALAQGHTLQQAAALTDKPLAKVVETIFARPHLMAAWDAYSHPERMRQVVPERYPDALEIWQREHNLQLQGDPSSKASEAHTIGRLADDQRAQAIVRILCVAVQALAERAYRGTLPGDPAALHDPELVDPYQGRALHYRVAKNGVELTVWAVGPDLRDDGGSDDWTDAGPRDITVHVLLH